MYCDLWPYVLWTFGRKALKENKNRGSYMRKYGICSTFLELKEHNYHVQLNLHETEDLHRFSRNVQHLSAKLFLLLFLNNFRCANCKIVQKQ
jgi:hypothetical protein